MSVITDAINALTAVLHDPDIRLDHEDADLTYEVIGMLADYRVD